ncbi:hypothetical protein C8R47DRAFT_1136271 [Mycena vitilis]|nr:hypothetical protein C8R47DRAFT_1136271 [Mycena vitilis]
MPQPKSQPHPFPFAMSSGSASRAPLPRGETRSSPGSIRTRPRPRSPPSLYVAYETAQPKAPKPLIKLEKKSKTKSSPQKGESHPPNTPPARPYTSPSESSLSSTSQRLPSVASFLSRGRKSVTANPPTPRITTTAPPRVPLPRPVHYRPPVEAIGDLPPTLPPLDKASRILGDDLLQQPGADDQGFIANDSADTVTLECPSAYVDGDGDGSSVDEEAAGGDCDAEVQRDSLFSPIEFASVWAPTITVSMPSLVATTPTSETMSWDDSEPATPVTQLGPSYHQRVEQNGSLELYPSAPDRCSKQEDSDSELAYLQYVPDRFGSDTPFLDKIVAVDPNGVARNAFRESSVVRVEAKEGWVGEWNQDDMQDVIHKIRLLKG